MLACGFLAGHAVVSLERGLSWREGAVHILVINSGSSSIKFSMFDSGEGTPVSLVEGEVTGIGVAKSYFKFRDAAGKDLSGGKSEVKADSPVEAIALVLEAVSGEGMP
jgi:acetate kinase